MAGTVKIKECSKWKKIAVSDDESDGFCGIEELTDYELVRVKKKPKRLRSKDEDENNLQAEKKSKKRKIDVAHARIDDAITIPKKKTKKKPTKKKNHKEVGTLPQETIDNIQPDDFDSWDNMFVPETVLKALQELQYKKPTTIQELTLPSAIRDRMDIVGAAETGSGKTLAFGIPLIHHILRLKEEETVDVEEEFSDAKVEEPSTEKVEESNDVNDDDLAVVKIRRNKKLYALILTPTRELAIQVKNHLKAVAKYAGIMVMAIVGGMAPQKQERLMKKCPEIIVATPGRLWEMIQESNNYLTTVSDIRFLVVDEADRMLEAGHFVEFANLLELLNSDVRKREKRQTFVFSATLSMVHDLPNRLWMKRKKKKKLTQTQKIQSLVEIIGISKRPKIVDITRKLGTVETLQEARINCDKTEKDFYLYYLLVCHPGRTLVFCNTIDCVRRLGHILEILKRQVLSLHASMHQKQRLKNLERFAASENAVLIATDVAARGLDIPNIQHVVHYQVPGTSETYVHRSGRTARANRKGLSVMLIDPEEMRKCHGICHTLNRDEPLALFPVDRNVLRSLQKTVQIARKLDEKSHRWRRVNSENNWFQKAAEEMDLELDDDDLLNNLGDDYEKSQQQKEMKVLQKQLDRLLEKPNYPRHISKQYPATSGMIPALERQGKLALEKR